MILSALQKDTWMYPNILLFYPEMARHILKYRIRTLEGARQNAEQQGYKVSNIYTTWNFYIVYIMIK